MKAHMILAALHLASIGSQVLADTHYVDINNGTPSDPYTSWATAATNIQDAIDAASSNDMVLVNDGTFDTSGALVSNMLNRVVLNKDDTVESVIG
jgi:hypothetical protein